MGLVVAMLSPSLQGEEQLSSRIGDFVERLWQFGLGLLPSYSQHVGELPCGRSVVVLPHVGASLVGVMVMDRADVPAVALGVPPDHSSATWGWSSVVCGTLTTPDRAVPLPKVPREHQSTASADLPSGSMGSVHVAQLGGASHALAGLAIAVDRVAATASSCRRGPTRAVSPVGSLDARQTPHRHRVLGGNVLTADAATPRRWVSTSRGVVANASKVTSYQVVHVGMVTP